MGPLPDRSMTRENVILKYRIYLRAKTSVFHTFSKEINIDDSNEEVVVSVKKLF